MEINIESKIFILIIIISVILLIISLIKQRLDLIVNFALRIFAGLLAIYILNTVFQSINIDLAVGINAVTSLIVGVLGIPGIILLYGLILYL